MRYLPHRIDHILESIQDFEIEGILSLFKPIILITQDVRHDITPTVISQPPATKQITQRRLKKQKEFKVPGLETRLRGEPSDAANSDGGLFEVFDTLVL